jgi:hypothetical protein
VLREVPATPAVPDDPLDLIVAEHRARGLEIDAETSKPGWLGEPLDVGYAIDVLHPLASRASSRL